MEEILTSESKLILVYIFDRLILYSYTFKLNELTKIDINQYLNVNLLVYCFSTATL